MAKDTIVVSLTNLKGGVAKTTTSANLGAGLARMGYKVLLIDWDPQGNATRHFGFDHKSVPILYSAFDTEEEELFNRGNLKYIPIDYYPERLFLFASNYNLSRFEQTFSDPRLGGGHMVLSNVVNLFKSKVDFVIIDCQADISLLTINAYYASDFLFIPVEVGVFSKDGMDQIFNSINRLNKNYGKKIKIGGVFFCRTEPNTIIGREYMQYFESTEEIPLMKSQIRRNVAIIESQQKGMDIFTYDVKMSNAKKQQISNSNEDYYNFVNEFLYLVGASDKLKTSREGSNHKTERKKGKGSLREDFREFLNA